MFFRRKTKENHAKSVQNVRKLLLSLGKTKEKQKKKTPPPQKKKTPKNRPSIAMRGCDYPTQTLSKHKVKATFFL